METDQVQTDRAGIYEATPAEFTSHMLKVDRARIRRRSEDMEAPNFKVDGNEITRIVMLAIAVEKKTYQHREKGARAR